MAAAKGDHPRAARSLGAAERLRETIGVPMDAHDRFRYDETVALLREGLSAEEARAAWEQGREHPDEVVTEARS